MSYFTVAIVFVISVFNIFFINFNRVSNKLDMYQLNASKQLHRMNDATLFFKETNINARYSDRLEGYDIKNNYEHIDDIEGLFIEYQDYNGKMAYMVIPSQTHTGDKLDIKSGGEMMLGFSGDLLYYPNGTIIGSLIYSGNSLSGDILTLDLENNKREKFLKFKDGKLEDLN